MHEGICGQIRGSPDSARWTGSQNKHDEGEFLVTGVNKSYSHLNDGSGEMVVQTLLGDEGALRPGHCSRSHAAQTAHIKGEPY